MAGQASDEVRKLQAHPEIYAHIDALAARLAGGLAELPDVTVNRVGSLLSVFFTSAPVTDYESARRSDTARYARYFTHMLDAGIYLAPAQFEAMFLSAAHSQADVDATLAAARSFGG